MLSNAFITAFLSLASISLASPAPKVDRRSFVERDGQNLTVFEHAATGAKMEFVTNSGICETTKGVNQYSGYLSVGQNMNMWFWFFEARNSPTTAPLATWFNGGPGCSSMIGLFQENGPCKFVSGDSTPTLNPYSFNNYANMLYIDQPIGVGFSYGDDPVTSTATAAPYVWALLQAFFAQFPQYQSRDFGIFTESYGGHYGPEFADYVNQQNAAITAGSAKGEHIKLVALGVNNGWFDAALQEPQYISYALNNTHKPFITASQANDLMKSFNNDCGPALEQCNSSGANSDCQNSDSTCANEIENPLTQTTANGGVAAYDFDVYDVREPSADPYPPKTYSSYLQTPSIAKAIGAKSTYQECPNNVYDQFSSTGDNSRNFLPQLSSVVQSGVQTVVWAGDADFICNWLGNQAAANAVEFPGAPAFHAKTLEPYSVNGKEGGTFKQQDNFAFLRVFGAGHEVPYYTPELALQVFEQTMKQQPLSST